MRQVMLLSMVLSTLLLGATSSAIEPATTTVAQTTVQTPPVLRHGCMKLYPRATHDQFARKYYRGTRSLTQSQRHWLWRLRTCQPSDKAQRGAVRLEHRLKADRNARRARGCGSPTCNRRLLVFMATKRFGRSGFCLLPIIRQESGFNHRVNNGGHVGPPIPGRAYGIPQALPAHKMAAFGRDWATNPRTQIRWLLWYVRSRFGGPCQALAYKRANGTY
jgi:hypothetical protein